MGRPVRLWLDWGEVEWPWRKPPRQGPPQGPPPGSLNAKVLESRVVLSDGREFEWVSARGQGHWKRGGWRRVS